MMNLLLSNRKKYRGAGGDREVPPVPFQAIDGELYKLVAHRSTSLGQFPVSLFKYRPTNEMKINGLRTDVPELYDTLVLGYFDTRKEQKAYTTELTAFLGLPVEVEKES